MGICMNCNKNAWSLTVFNGKNYCDHCYHELKLNKILTRGNEVHEAEDLKGWDHGDMSDLFWYHLGEYVKDQNPEIHFPIIKSCLYWAFHDSHGLSSSFCHALKWAKVELNEVLSWTC